MNEITKESIDEYAEAVEFLLLNHTKRFASASFFIAEECFGMGPDSSSMENTLLSFKISRCLAVIIKDMEKEGILKINDNSLRG